jgi:choline dehydrogenase-like flavoprotein
MEHAHWHVGEILTEDPTAFIDMYYRRFFAGHHQWLGWKISDAQQEALGVSNCHSTLDLEVERDATIFVARRLWRDIQQGEVPDRLIERSLEVLRGIGPLAQAAWRKKVLNTYVNKPIKKIILDTAIDPIPYRDSRVTLGEERDSLGMRRVKLDWRFHPQDGRSVTRTARALAAEITRLGLGRVRLHPALADDDGAWIHAGNLDGYDIAPDLPPMAISWHHMGTTRMADDPRQGVVNSDGRIHDVANLYVLGSSTFPITGTANPTLTIVALTLRLAEQLQHELVV